MLQWHVLVPTCSSFRLLSRYVRIIWAAGRECTLVTSSSTALFTSIACSMYSRSLCSAQRYLSHLINLTIHAVIQDAKIPGMTTQTRMTLYILLTHFLEVVSIDVQPISLSSRYKQQLYSRRVKIEIGKSTYSPSLFPSPYKVPVSVASCETLVSVFEMSNDDQQQARGHRWDVGIWYILSNILSKKLICLVSWAHLWNPSCL